MGVHIAVGKVHRRALQRFTPKLQRTGLVVDLLSGGVVHTQPLELFFDQIHSCYHPLRRDPAIFSVLFYHSTAP